MSLSGVLQSYVCYLAITVFFTHRKKSQFYASSSDLDNI